MTESDTETEALSVDRFYDALEDHGRPVITATALARRLDVSQERAMQALDALEERGDVERASVAEDPTVFYASDWARMVERERVVFFPERREIVVDQPEQFTRAQLAQFARLKDTTRTGGYLYEVRREDVWQAPYETHEELVATMKSVLPVWPSTFEDWVVEQYKRAHRFELRTHEDGYVVLVAANESLLGNVAEQRLPEGALRAVISDTEAWVAEDRVAEVKRVLYEAGYPVEDGRDLESGDALDVHLHLRLRDYQQEWVDRFEEKGAGVLVGPPGSGKTVAAMGCIEAVGGETLVLVPSRELATQWREELLAHTDLTDSQVGEYHGGTKQIRPVTIATYQTAGMDRHRQLFDDREWGLVVYDEVHHVPAPIHRRSVDLQSKHRLGLTASPVRGDDREEEIFTLVGPPIGTDWDALFDAGFVQDPDVEVRYVPWGSDDAQERHAKRDGHDKRQAAAANPAKIAETTHVLEREHPEKKALVFVEYLDHGTELAEALDAPFISGDMPHSERDRLFREFRNGDRRVLVVSRVADEGIDLPDAEVAVVASGLGGSRRQGTQRAGRTMRPEGSAHVVVLATRGTNEEEFAQNQQRHLASKGISVRDGDARAFADADSLVASDDDTTQDDDGDAIADDDDAIADDDDDADGGE
ncbi:DEAD/DEAH box helicase family protein [Halorubellus sp. JP-L1]|uniref:DEAD/DEAH box helicase family protein n=1 Tax=Halorubellus sp. JP-L1 TaxID=2715753 RepID=UPI0034E98076